MKIIKFLKNCDIVPSAIAQKIKEGGVIYSFIRKYKLVTTIHDVSSQSIEDFLWFYCYTTHHTLDEVRQNESILAETIAVSFHRNSIEIKWASDTYLKESHTVQFNRFFLPRLETYSMPETGRRCSFQRTEDGAIFELH